LPHPPSPLSPSPLAPPPPCHLVKRTPGKCHFLHLDDFTAAELRSMLVRGLEVKRLLRENPRACSTSAPAPYRPFDGFRLGMIFAKASMRTRVSFENGFAKLGGVASYYGPAEHGVGQREEVRDVARVLSRYNDALMARLYGHDEMLELAQYSSVPVINGLTDHNHPCQIMADALTMAEDLAARQGDASKGMGEDGRSPEEVVNACWGPDAPGVKLTYVGDGNNMAHSWLRLAAVLPNLTTTIVCAPGYEPDADVVALVPDAARGAVVVVADGATGVARAVQGADYVYTDVWASMGQKDEAEKRARDFAGFTVTKSVLEAAGPTTRLLHCLPAERGVEVDDGAIEDATRSLVWDQAENRMWAQMGVMLHCFDCPRPGQ